MALSDLTVKCNVAGAKDENMEMFWDKMSPTLESMLLMKDEELAKRDMLEVLDYLPEYKGKRILELNAGIGRFTGLLAEDANHVTAVDLIQKFLDVNKIENDNYDNITFKCANAAELDFPEGSFDLVLSGWLNTSINNHSMRTIMECALKWLSPGGHVVFREQCQLEPEGCYHFKFAGYYRSQLEYCQILQNIKCAEACFGNIRTKTSLAFLHVVGLPIESHFMAKRVSQDDANCLMDAANKIYTIPVISKLEWMFGQSWINPGGEETTQKLICQLGLTQDDYVLNLGSGTGGAAFLLAKHYGVNVHAVELSTNMICTALGRYANPDINLRKKIQFEAADITEAEFRDESYDVIFSSNSIFHFKEKQKIFTKLYRWLKPGGKLLIADYCKGSCKDEFQELLDNFAINLMSIKDYEKILKDSGFGDILVKDESENLSHVLQKKLKAFNTTKDTFAEKFSKNEFCDLVKWGSNTLNCVESKQLALGIFWARKC